MEVESTETGVFLPAEAGLLPVEAWLRGVLPLSCGLAAAESAQPLWVSATMERGLAREREMLTSLPKEETHARLQEKLTFDPRRRQV